MTLSEFIFMPYNYLCQKQYAIAQEIFVENYSEAAKNSDKGVEALYGFGICLSLLGMNDIARAKNYSERLSRVNAKMSTVINNLITNGYSEQLILDMAIPIRNQFNPYT